MTKYVIDTVELKKRQYVIDAYSEREAIDKMEDAEPVLQEIVSDSIYNIHTINEYEYKHTPDYHEGHDLVKPFSLVLVQHQHDASYYKYLPHTHKHL